jgi:hypothetical protein
MKPWSERKKLSLKKCCICEKDFQPYCPGSKHCDGCKLEAKKKRHRVGMRNWRNKNRHHCRLVKADWDLRKIFGITYEKYKEMFDRQNGKCAICHKEGNGRGRGVLRPLAVDHCHTTKRIRGLLCSDCNTAIGLLRENVEVLKSAILYLRRKKND